MSEMAQFGLTIAVGFVAYWIVGLIVIRLLLALMPKAIGCEFGTEGESDSELTFGVMIWPITLIYVFCVVLNRITKMILGVK